MTRTKEQLRKAVFGKLQTLRRKLHAAGVPCNYARSVLSHANGGTAFSLTCRLADDQATLLPQITVHTAEGTQSFDHQTFGQALARLKELFQDQGGIASQGSDTQDSDTPHGNGCTANPDNLTLFRHEGDAK